MGSVSTMKALIFHGPFDVRLEERPIPEIIEPTDVVLKTTAAALCGSELHRYRGHSKANLEGGYITGHEGAGIVYEVGSAVKKFKKGDYVVVPFTTSCGECVQCEVGLTGRCVKGRSFGSPPLNGSQADYFRVPLADSTLYPAPVELGDLVILMADIFPTGFNGTRNAFSGIPESQWNKQTIAIIGCGPVAMCAIVSAMEYKPARIFAVDSVPERLERARSLGAEPLNFKTQDVKGEIFKATKGRGADAVIEVVGHSDALRTAFEVVRFGGKISVIGVHNEAIPFSAYEAYNHNTHVQFGRCPVRTVFKDALDVLVRNKSKFEGFIDVILPRLDDSFADALNKFEKNQVNKVVFKPHGLDPFEPKESS